LSSSHRINVLGRELQVRSTASPERVRQIEKYINSRIAEAEASTKCADPLIIAVLALLNIAESFIDISSESEKRNSLDNERIFRLMQYIEDATR
jgi:cell division protein ZapA